MVLTCRVFSLAWYQLELDQMKTSTPYTKDLDLLTQSISTYNQQEYLLILLFYQTINKYMNFELYPCTLHLHGYCTKSSMLI